MNRKNLSILPFLAAVSLAQSYTDLDVLSVSVPATVNAGQSITVNYDVRNIGNLYSGNLWEDAIYLSSSASLTGATRLRTICKDFRGYPGGGLAPGWSYDALMPAQNPGVSVTIPASVQNGTHYIGYRTNDSNSWDCINQNRWPVPEPSTRFANNIVWRAIRVYGRPDFTLASLVATPAQARPGTPVNIAVNVVNGGGSLNSGSIYVDFYLSTTATTQGSFLARSPLMLVAGGSQQALQLQVVFPSVPLGDYHLVGFVDSTNAVLEQNEQNNTLALPFRVAPPPSATPYGAACPGMLGMPTLTATGTPTIGNATFALTVGNVPTFTIAGLLVGFNNVAWNGNLLPFSLPGAPSCVLLVNPTSSQFGFTATGNSVTFPMPLPNEPGLLGLQLFAQGDAVDFFANSLGAIFTAGLRIDIG